MTKPLDKSSENSQDKPFPFKPWKTLDTKVLLKAGFFRMIQQSCELGDGRVMPKYYTMEFQDWVNIVPVLPSGEILMIRQYRHPSRKVHLEIPGGGLDAGEGDNPLMGAKRELLEETGYTSNEWIPLGAHYPNPALQTNRMHSYLALNCEKKQEPQWDPFEELELFPMKMQSVLKEVMGQAVDHSIVMATLFQAYLHLNRENL